MLLLAVTRSSGEMKKKEEKSKIRKWAMAAVLLWCLSEVSAPTDMVEKVMKAMDTPNEVIQGWSSWWGEEEKYFVRSEIEGDWDVEYDSAIKGFVRKALEKAPKHTSEHSWFKLLLVHHIAWHSPSSSSSSSSLQMLILLRVPTHGRDFCVNMLMKFIQNHVAFTVAHPIFFQHSHVGCRIFILVVNPHDKNRIPEFMRTHFKNHDIDVLSILKTEAIDDLDPNSPVMILD